MKRIEDYVEYLETATTPEFLFDRLVKIMADFGYEKVAYGFATDHPGLGIKKMHGHMNSFPSDWMSHYAQENLIEIDPIPAYMLRSPLPSFWSGATRSISSKADKFMKDAAEAGLKDGALVPLHGIGGEVAGLSVSSNRIHPNQSFENLAKIQFLSTYFHEIYKSFIVKGKPIDPDIFTFREIQVLYLSVMGKSDPEISDLIGIKVPTVRYHWGKIFKKLDAHKREYATCKALALRIVTPYELFKNYQS